MTFTNADMNTTDQDESTLPFGPFGYQVSDGKGGWIDINQIDDLNVLRNHLKDAIDALEEIYVANATTTAILKKWQWQQNG